MDGKFAKPAIPLGFILSLRDVWDSAQIHIPAFGRTPGIRRIDPAEAALLFS
jgi:hypothetical protein